MKFVHANISKKTSFYFFYYLIDIVSYILCIHKKYGIFRLKNEYVSTFDKFL